MINKSSIAGLVFFFTMTILTISSEVKAQTLIPDEISLEQTVYANLQKGIDEFHGITEKHTYRVEGKVDFAATSKRLKADKRVISVLQNTQTNAIIVTIRKTELNEAKRWIQPLIETDKVKVVSHELQFYKEN